MRGKLFLIAVLAVASITVLAGPPGSIRFIENKNQWPAQFKFGTDLSNGQIRFASDHIFFSFWENKREFPDKGLVDRVPHAPHLSEGGIDLPTVNGHTYEVRFLNANAQALVSGLDKTPTRYNYFVGNDKDRWASNASSYSALYYHDVYRGIDMRYYSDKGRMKYEWIVEPQVNPLQIKVQYKGLKAIYLDNENLHLETSINEIWEMKPYAYQEVNGKRVQIMCRYALKNNVLTYELPEGYDECLPLVIDPILIFSAYSGSFLDNWGNTATYDERGNVYSGGIVSNSTSPTGFPITPGAYQLQHGGGGWDVGILKYDSSGSKLLYCTFLGGSGTETPQSLVTNAAGELLILGATSSGNFPVTNGSQFKGGDQIDPLWGIPYGDGTDLFVTKLSVNGDQLLGSTYLGGSKNDGVNFISGFMYSLTNKVESPLARNYGDQLRGDIITDEDGFVYIASSTLSNDFPAMNAYAGGSHDAVVVKLQPDLNSVVWSRLIGGTSTDAAYSIKLDKNNRIFVAGGSTSGSIAGMNGLKKTNTGNVDGWVMSLTNDGVPVDGTFLGTTNYDQVYFVDLNSDDEVFVFGQTLGTYVSGKSGRQFVHKLTNDLSTSLWAQVIGSGTISPTAFLVSDCGYIYLSGWGGAINAPSVAVSGGTLFRNYIGGNTFGFPVTSDAYQRNTSGNDFYFLVLSEDGQENLYATYLGGAQSATHVDGGTSRFDKKGIVYHAVCAGCGGQSDFPAVNVPPAHQLNRSANCNNAVFKFDLSLLKARLQTNSIKLDMPGLNKVCLNDPIVFQNKSNGGETFHWDLGDGTKFTTLDTVRFKHVYANPGKYQVWLKAIDRGTCQVVDSVSTSVEVFLADGTIQNDDKICAGDSYQLKASGGDRYHWVSEDNTFQSNDQSPVVRPDKTTTYYIRLTEYVGCVHLDSVTISVITPLEPEFEIERIGDCNSVPSVKVKNLTEGISATDDVYFDFGDGHKDDGEEVLYPYPKGGDYTIKLVGARDICVTEKSIAMTFQPLKIPNVITPLKRDGLNDVFFIEIGEGTGKSPADVDVKANLEIFNRWGKTVYSNTEYQNDWDGADLPAGVYYYVVRIEDYGTCRSWIHVIK